MADPMAKYVEVLPPELQDILRRWSASLAEVETLRRLVERLWGCEHVAGYDWEVASLDDFTSGAWFGTIGTEHRLSEAEVKALRSALHVEADDG